MAMVNPAAGIPNSAVMNPVAAAQLATLANQKDSRWLTLEVCREYQRNKCTRTELECKFAHPPPHVEVQNGRVTCCFDSIKGKCQRKEPPCKYLHPPQHLREQLLQNGRNNLIMKNLQMQMLTQQAGYQVMPMTYDTSGKTFAYSSTPVWPQPVTGIVAPQYIGGVPPAFQYATSLPGMPAAGLISSADGSQMMQSMTLASTAQLPGGVPTTVATQSKLQRADRLESGGTYWVDLNAQDAPGAAVPVSVSNGMVPGMPQYIKRPAVADKNGLPVYQPATAAAYQQALSMQLQHQQGYMPVAFTGHPTSVQRF